MVHLVVSCPFEGIDCKLPNTLEFVSLDVQTWASYDVKDMIHEHGRVSSHLQCIYLTATRGDFGMAYQGEHRVVLIYKISRIS